jgi:hypothetical protein
MHPTTMRAWCARAYGGPEVLELREVPLAPHLGYRNQGRRPIETIQQFVRQEG